MDPIAERVATKFRTKKELQDYLHEHPDAERGGHSVMSPAESHRYYEEHKKDAAIADRVAEGFLGAPKKAPAPKSYPATAHVIEQLKKVGLERASATINSPISMAEEASKAVWGKVHLVVPKDYQGPGGTVIQGVDNLPVRLARHPSSGNFEGNKPGHLTFDFVVITRDKKGKEVQLPLEGVHLFMQWQPVYRSEGVGGGGLGHRYIDRFFVSEVGTHAGNLEGKLHHLKQWYTSTYHHEPEFVTASVVDPLAERVAARFLQGSIPEAAHKAGIEYLKHAGVADLVHGMSAEAKKDGLPFGMRDAKEAMTVFFAGGHAATAPAQVAAARYLKSPKGSHLVSKLTQGLGNALKAAGMKPVGFKDVGQVLVSYLSA